MLIEYKNVDIDHGKQNVLSGLNFQLDENEFVYLVGKVGSGKSSFLSTIYGELPVDKGEATVLDYNMRKLKRKHIPDLRRRIGVIFQDFQLLTDRSVKENLLFVLKATGWKKRNEMEERINEVLQLVGMQAFEDKMPNELSGGQQQRIAIARAMLNKPQIIIADEPTGNLDVFTGKQICQLLHSISQQGASVIMSTHNLSLVNEYPGVTYSCTGNSLDLLAYDGIKTDDDIRKLNSILEENEIEA